jgi:DNA polymerase-3 subunit delta
MKYEDIKNELIKKEYKKTYVLYGDDEYLKESVYNALKSGISKISVNGLEESRYDDNSDISDIINEVCTYSFTGSTKIIRCKNTGFFNSSENNDKLQKLIGLDMTDAYVIFIEKNVDKKLISYKAYDKAAFAYDISKGKQDDVVTFVKNRFIREKKEISYDDINLFIQYSGLNLSFISMNIDKILLYIGDDKAVKSDTIKALCSGITDVKAYELFNHLCNKDLASALDVYNDLVMLKYALPFFLAVLYNGFYELYEAKVKNVSASNDYRTRKMMENAKKFNKKDLKDIIAELCEMDHDFKSGRIDQDSSMVILFSKIVNCKSM